MEKEYLKKCKEVEKEFKELCKKIDELGIIPYLDDSCEIDIDLNKIFLEY